jgi:hypothetical protein
LPLSEKQGVGSSILPLATIMKKLNSFKKNVYSQLGEDGILEALFPFLNKKIQDLFVVEFGAWDGVHLSNTFNFIEKGSSALLIECDEERFKDLIVTAAKFPKIIPKKVFIESFGENTLDNIIDKLDSNNKNPDILSIDIDSVNNLAIWKSTKLEPSILIIEFDTRFLSFETQESLKNNTMEKDNLFFDTYEYTVSRGYKLIYTSFNMIFVKENLFKELNKNYSIQSNPYKIFDFRNFIKNRVISRSELIKIFVKNYKLIPFKYFLLKLSPKIIKNIYFKYFYYKGLNT